MREKRGVYLTPVSPPPVSQSVRGGFRKKRNQTLGRGDNDTHTNKERDTFLEIRARRWCRARIMILLLLIIKGCFIFSSSGSERLICWGKGIQTHGE